jgi:hypothetical protein
MRPRSQLTGSRQRLSFPTATNCGPSPAAAPGRRRNGTKLSCKLEDKALLAADPQLVIDGAVTAARLVGAEEVFLAAGRADGRGLAALERAVAERHGRDGNIALRIVAAPDRFVAGEESALVNFLNGGPAKPTVDRPFERGVHGRPTLVQNVETLANVALIARHGADWFRRLGAAQEPGSLVVAQRRPCSGRGIRQYDLARGAHGVQGMAAMPQAFLVGSYFGTWVAARRCQPSVHERVAPPARRIARRAP